MPANYTENLSLNQWEANDKVLRTDFNADNAKIDAAVKAAEDRTTALAAQVDTKANQSALTTEINARTALAAQVAKKGNCRIYYTTYVGDGAETKSLTFPQKPLAVFIMGNSTFLATLCGSDTLLGYSGGSSSTFNSVTWSGNSLTWTYLRATYSSDFGNSKATTYQLVALLDAST